MDLAFLYGITDHAARCTLLDLGRAAEVPGWWRHFGEVVPDWFEPYLDLEQNATMIRSFQAGEIHDLLQTADYTRVVTRLRNPHVSRGQVDQHLEVLTRRQQVLRRCPPPRVWVILDESALHRHVGDAAIMRAQLQHLIEVSERPSITIQILARQRGDRAGQVSMTLLRPPEPALPDVAYIPQPQGAVYCDRCADLHRYRQIMDALAVAAQPPGTSRMTLTQILTQR